MKLKSEIIKDKKGKIISYEEFVYNQNDKLVKQEYKDELGNLKFYKNFEYDETENCIKIYEFSNDNELQVSFEFYYNDENEQVKTIEKTAEGLIWDWTEIDNQTEDNLKIWLAKDSEGNIIHKTVENLLDHSQKRYNSEGILYEQQYKKLDNLNRLIEKLITTESGIEKESHFYSYCDNKEVWQYFSSNKLVKTEEIIFDNQHNIISHNRKDDKGNLLEWYRFERDSFGNKTKYIWGTTTENELRFKTIHNEYYKN